MTHRMRFSASASKHSAAMIAALCWSLLLLGKGAVADNPLLDLVGIPGTDEGEEGGLTTLTPLTEPSSSNAPDPTRANGGLHGNASTANSYLDQYGSFFLHQGGHQPPNVNPSRLDDAQQTDGAFGSNSSRKAIGSDENGYFPWMGHDAHLHPDNHAPTTVPTTAPTMATATATKAPTKAKATKAPTMAKATKAQTKAKATPKPHSTNTGQVAGRSAHLANDKKQAKQHTTTPTKPSSAPTPAASGGAIGSYDSRKKAIGSDSDGYFQFGLDTSTTTKAVTKRTAAGLHSDKKKKSPSPSPSPHSKSDDSDDNDSGDGTGFAGLVTLTRTFKEESNSSASTGYRLVHVDADHNTEGHRDLTTHHKKTKTSSSSSGTPSHGTHGSHGPSKTPTTAPTIAPTNESGDIVQDTMDSMDGIIGPDDGIEDSGDEVVDDNTSAAATTDNNATDSPANIIADLLVGGINGLIGGDDGPDDGDQGNNQQDPDSKLTGVGPPEGSTKPTSDKKPPTPTQGSVVQADTFGFSFFKPFETKIVGGKQVSHDKAVTKYPFYVLWYDANCGGSLVAPDMVLTAAHCAQADDSSTLSRKTLYLLTSTHGEGLQRHLVDFVVNPVYGTRGKEFDFMLLRLDQSGLVDESGTATGAELVTLNRDRAIPPTRGDVQVVGFGLTEENGSAMAPYMNEATLQVSSYSTCESQYENRGTIVDDTMICAGVSGGGKDACQGDSGSPVLDKVTHTQVGVVSFGIGCARASHNGVNARVSAGVDWIDANVCLMSRLPPASCYPFLVEWGLKDCVGVMVADDMVLTGAHCGHWDEDPLYHNTILFPAVPGLERSVSAHIPHPSYNYYTRDFDLQLLKLNQSAIVDEQGTPTGVLVAPIYRSSTMPDTLLTEISITGHSSGFSVATSKSAGHNAGPDVQQVSMKWLGVDVCPLGKRIDPNNMACAGVVPDGDNPQAQTCRAAGGSPLLTTDGEVASIASWGKNCDFPHDAGISAKVGPATSWIDEAICRLSDYEIPGDIACPNGPSENFRYDGTGQFTVTVQHDEYPNEVAWRVIHPATATELYYQAYNTVHEPQVTVSKAFEGLPAGKYHLEIADLETDGLCCDYGYGFVSVNDTSGNQVWLLDGGFGEYHSVTIHVASDGAITTSDDQDDYVSPAAIVTQGNLRLASRDPSAFDPLWPGVYPETMSKMIVNVKLDLFPEEVSWKLLSLAQDKNPDNAGDWTEVLSVQGEFGNEVTSNTVDVTPNVTFYFKIDDIGEDGICCRYRNGFVTITKKISGSEKAVVFQHNGDFTSSAEVYLQADEEGRDLQVVDMFTSTTT